MRTFGGVCCKLKPVFMCGKKVNFGTMQPGMLALTPYITLVSPLYLLDSLNSNLAILVLVHIFSMNHLN